MLSLMDKEITEYSDEELAGLIRDNSFTTAARQYAVWFLTYIHDKEPEQLKFNLEMSMLRRETVRGEEDFYTPEEWASFADVFFDIDRHIEKAFAELLLCKVVAVCPAPYVARMEEVGCAAYPRIGKPD